MTQIAYEKYPPDHENKLRLQRGFCYQPELKEIVCTLEQRIEPQESTLDLISWTPHNV